MTNEPQVRLPIPNPHVNEGKVSRPTLSRYAGRIVTVECTWSAVAKRHENGDWLYHVTDVVVYPAASYGHIWLLGMPNAARRKLYEGTRFSFRGEVIQYQRLDGTQDYGVVFAGGFRVNKS